jgi:hypothetical protein
MKDLPKAVQQTVKEQSKGGQVIGLSKEVEGGKTIYEAEMKINGHGKDILIDSSGKVVEAEEEMTLSSLMAPVQAQINKNIGKGKILKLESLTNNGVLSSYEAVVETGGEKSGIKMGTDGKPLAKGK